MDPVYGDRMTKLVLIGTELERKEIEAELDMCLLTDTEMEDDWNLLTDPFEWVITYT